MDAHALFVASDVFKSDITVHDCKDSVVLANVYVRTRQELGSTLPDDDRAAANQFAGKALDS
jgi:hypothetical protein